MRPIKPPVDSPIGACAEKLGQLITANISTVASCLYQHEHIGAHRTANGETWTTAPITLPPSPYCDAEPPDAGHGCDRPPNHSGPHITSGDDLNGYQLWGQRCGAPHPEDESPCTLDAGHDGSHGDNDGAWYDHISPCAARHPHGAPCTHLQDHAGPHCDGAYVWETT